MAAFPLADANIRAVYVLYVYVARVCSTDGSALSSAKTMAVFPLSDDNIRAVAPYSFAMRMCSMDGSAFSNTITTAAWPACEAAMSAVSRAPSYLSAE